MEREKEQRSGSGMHSEVLCGRRPKADARLIRDIMGAAKGCGSDDEHRQSVEALRASPGVNARWSAHLESNTSEGVS